MKRLTIVFIWMCVLSLAATAQDGNIGIGTLEPNASAILDLEATNKGLLIPRVTLTDAHAAGPITEPLVKGLLVFNMGGSFPEGFYYWSGDRWTQLRTNACVNLNAAYNCPNAGEGRTIVADTGAVEIAMPSNATQQSALLVESNKDKSLVGTFIGNGSGVGVYVDAKKIDNRTAAVQARTFGEYNSAVWGISEHDEKIGATIKATDSSNVVGGTENGITKINTFTILGEYLGKGNGVAIWGTSRAADGQSVASIMGVNKSTKEKTAGIKGQGVNGVIGISTIDVNDPNQDGSGVMGQGVTGVYGLAQHNMGQGVLGINDKLPDPDNEAYSVGVEGHGFAGVWGETADSLGYGVCGVNTQDTKTSIIYGVGVRGDGNVGVQGNGYTGVRGEGYYGVWGITDIKNGRGIRGINTNTEKGSIGILGNGYYGIWGETTNAEGIGIVGEGFEGIQGQTNSKDGIGLIGANFATEGNAIGVFGQSGSNVGWGFYTPDRFGVQGAKNFVIPHPTKPDKILLHACIESPMPTNMYSGNVVLDNSGEAIVELPEYFSEININFRYQLTPIGGYAGLYVKDEIKGNRFVIAGGEAGMKVSWTVYADRYDEYMRKHPEQRMDVVDKPTDYKTLFEGVKVAEKAVEPTEAEQNGSKSAAGYKQPARMLKSHHVAKPASNINVKIDDNTKAATVEKAQ